MLQREVLRGLRSSRMSAMRMLDQALDLLMGKDVEALLLHCIEGDPRDVGGAEFPRLGGLARLLFVLLFQRIGAASSAGRLRPASAMPVDTKAGHSTDTPIDAFSSCSSSCKHSDMVTTACLVAQ